MNERPGEGKKRGNLCNYEFVYLALTKPEERRVAIVWLNGLHVVGNRMGYLHRLKGATCMTQKGTDKKGGL